MKKKMAVLAAVLLAIGLTACGNNNTGKFAVVTPAKYKKDYPYLKEVDSLALTNVQLNLQDAFGSCFNKSRKTNNGFPKFKSAKRSRKSYTTNCQYPKTSNKLKQPTIRLDDKNIVLPKVGSVKAVIHRKPLDGWMLKSATVSMDSDPCIGCVACGYEGPCVQKDDVEDIKEKLPAGI